MNTRNKSIHQLFEQQAARTPNKVAVVYENQQLTYAQLNARANQLARHLQTLGVGLEVLVGICVERSLEMVVGLLAILKAGGAYVPLDPAYPKERLATILHSTRLQLLLTQQHLAADLHHTGISLCCLDTQWAEIATESTELAPTPTTPNRLAYIMYTSGSTGNPQGVEITIGQVERYLHAVNEFACIQPDDVYLHTASFAFSSSIRQLFLPLAQGAKVVIASTENTKNLLSLIELIHTEQVTVFDTVASVWNYLLIALEQRGTQLVDTQLRLLIFSGGLLTAQLLNRVRSQFPHPPQTINIYGQTETIGVCAYPIPSDFSKEDGYVPVGTAYSHNQLYVLDEQFQPVTATEIGELHIGGGSLARGYLNNPQLNQRKFIPNPFATNTRSDKQPELLYKTGDLARYLADGNLEIVGRQDFQVKIRGMRVEIEEIETVLMQHPDVQQAAVIGRKDRNGEQTIVAYLVANGQPIDLSQLRSFLQPKLADYMMPSAFEMLDALPLTPNKKLDRHRLPVPSRAYVTVVAARDRLEVELVAIWEKVLGVAPIGIKDNFFDLGGHSLLTLSLLNEIEKTLNTKLPVAALFQLTTVEKMASFFQQENRSAGGSTQEPILDSATATELFNDSSPEYSGLTTEEYRTLLAIVAGRKGKRPRQNSLMVAISEQGVKPPLFFCASASEEALPLAKNLGKEQPFYFLESGFVVTGNVESKIKAIAAHHVKDILLIQPEPPYLLCGYSFGAVLIDEIAQQLLVKGKQVSLVVMLDRYGSHPIYKFYSKIVVFLTDHWHHLAPLSFRDKLGHIQENIKSQISKRLPKSTNGEESQHPYTPQAYPGKVILFCSIPNKHDSVPPDRQIPIISSKFTLLFFRRAGWDQRIKPDLEIITVPGDHISMQEEPHVKVLAEKLQVCLDQAVIKTEQKNLGDSTPAFYKP